MLGVGVEPHQCKLDIAGLVAEILEVLKRLVPISIEDVVQYPSCLEVKIGMNLLQVMIIRGFAERLPRGWAARENAG